MLSKDTTGKMHWHITYGILGKNKIYIREMFFNDIFEYYENLLLAINDFKNMKSYFLKSNTTVMFTSGMHAPVNPNSPLALSLFITLILAVGRGMGSRAPP